MIKLTLNDDEIKVGSKIVFIKRMQEFCHRGTSYPDLDTLDIVATVHDIVESDSYYKCTFNDVSFLPQEIQSIPYWYLPKGSLEKY